MVEYLLSTSRDRRSVYKDNFNGGTKRNQRWTWESCKDDVRDGIKHHKKLDISSDRGTPVQEISDRII